MSTILGKLLSMTPLGNLFGTASKAGVVNSLLNKTTGAGLTAAEEAQNAFNASEAEKSRQFTAEQAQIARDWEEEQYNQYNSPEAKMRQYQEAGLNPALMYGSNTADASTSTSIPNAATASSGSSNNGVDIFSMLSAISNLKMQNAQIANIKADTEGKQITNSNLDAKLKADIQAASAKAGLDEASAKVAENNAALLAAKIPFASDVAEAEKNTYIANAATALAEKGIAEANLANWDWDHAKTVTVAHAQAYAKARGWNVVDGRSTSHSEEAGHSTSWNESLGGSVKGSFMGTGASASANESFGRSHAENAGHSDASSYNTGRGENSSNSASSSDSRTVYMVRDPQSKTIYLLDPLDYLTD